LDKQTKTAELSRSSPASSAKKRKVTGTSQTPRSEGAKDLKDDSSYSERSMSPITSPLQLRMEGIEGSHGSAVAAKAEGANHGCVHNAVENLQKTTGKSPDRSLQNNKKKQSNSNTPPVALSAHDDEVQGVSVSVGSKGNSREKTQISSRLSAADALIAAELEYVARNKDSGMHVCVYCICVCMLSIHACACFCMYLCVYAYFIAYVCAYTYTHTHTHKHTHTHSHFVHTPTHIYIQGDIIHHALISKQANRN
jgi:hypothetical protein